jgi:hypothetical protein
METKRDSKFIRNFRRAIDKLTDDELAVIFEDKSYLEHAPTTSREEE